MWAKVGAVLGAVVLMGVIALGGYILWMQPSARVVARDTPMPVRYEEGRFLAQPVAANGATLTLLTDTGGGMFLSRAAVARAGGAEGTTTAGRCRLPAFKPEASIPPPSGGDGKVPVWDEAEGDGMLGQRWFAGGVWTFDYPGRALVLRATPFVPTPDMVSHGVVLGFPSTLGLRDGHHPRFTLKVGGETVDALLDTGATAWLSPQAFDVVHDGGGSERATSFMQASLYDRLRAAHPEWRTITGGCAKSHADMLEVPVVEVAGLQAGPVWFTKRSDGTYVWMSSFMDKPIVASVGGNFFRHFRMTVDYPAARAYFEPAAKDHSAS